MVRIVIFLLMLAMAAFGFAWLADRPGEILLTWQGYRIETSLMVAIGAIALLTVALMIVWSALRLIFRIPAIMSITARARRHNRGFAAISKGMVAAAIGDARATEKAAREATKHLGDVPLTTLLQAQAAQISGDRDRAIETFNRMLEDPETRVLGLRGLYLEARRKGDSAAAQSFAKEAYGLAALPWAGQALLENHAMADDWSGALAVVESSIARKSVDKTVGNRQRGVLKTAMAMDIAERSPDEALRIAREAMKLAPDLIPAYAVAGRILARRGDIRRGGRILEDGWRVMPHPDIARAYLDLRPGDSATDRLARAQTLTRVHTSHPESRMTLARAALEARDFELARKTMAPLVDGSNARPTVRACLLMADLEETQYGVSGRVREWLARATRAGRDPMWIADGVVTDTWAPASPVTGKIDAFVWETPVEKLSASVAREVDDPPTSALAPAIPAKQPAAPAAVPVEAPVPAETAKMSAAKAGDGDAGKIDTKTIEAKPVDAKPVDIKATEKKPPEHKSIEEKTIDLKPVEPATVAVSSTGTNAGAAEKASDATPVATGATAKASKIVEAAKAPVVADSTPALGNAPASKDGAPAGKATEKEIVASFQPDDPGPKRPA